MKIAIVEWFPRVCGATDWGLHLAAGAGKEDNIVNLVTFSRSGRPLAAWNRPERWQVFKIADAAATLNRYDLLILTDVVCFAPQLVQKGREVPYYVEVMRQVKTPWTSMYHGGPYPAKYDAVMAELLRTRSFTGVLTTTRLPEARPRIEPLTKKKLTWHAHPYLPYDLARAPERTFKKTRAVMMTARIAVNKGQNVLMVNAPALRGDVHLWGYNAFGFPSIAYRLWELGKALGYKSTTRKPALRWDMRRLTHPNAHKFYTGAFTFKTSRATKLVYHDGYVHLDEIDWSPRIHVSLANADFRGTLEYVTLDAIAAGCLAVVPVHAYAYAKYGKSGPPVWGVDYVRSTEWSRPDGAVRGVVGYDRTELIRQINDGLALTETKFRTLVTAHRQTLIDFHDPRDVLRRIIRSVRSKL